jgi:hypothetical protein
MDKIHKNLFICVGFSLFFRIIPLTILIVAILSSCKFKSNLNRKQKAWIPYQGNEILIFQSSAGKSDTLFLDGRESFYTSDNPLDPFGKRFQCQRLNFQYVRPNDSSNFHIQGTLIQLTRLPNGDAEFFIGLQTRAGGFYTDSIFTLSSIRKWKTETQIIGGKTYTDIIIFSTRVHDVGEKSNAQIDSIWWSKRSGLVKYASNQGDQWTLKQ